MLGISRPRLVGLMDQFRKEGQLTPDSLLSHLLQSNIRTSSTNNSMLNSTRSQNLSAISSLMRADNKLLCVEKKCAASSIRYLTNGNITKEEPTLLINKLSKHVTHLELNAPKSKNAFSLVMGEKLCEALHELDADSSVRCVLLSGRGADFSSGVDTKSFLKLYQKLNDTDDVARRAKLLLNVIKQFQMFFKQLYAFEKPIICIHHGFSMGLAMELAACSDIRFCSKDAKMAIREVMIGISADVGSLQLLPRLSNNQSLLNELIMTGRIMNIEEALQIGFVSYVGETKEQTIAKALELAETISKRSPVAVQGSKRNLRFSRDQSFGVGLDYNAVWNASMMQGNDISTAIGAILSKSEDVEFEDF